MVLRFIVFIKCFELRFKQDLYTFYQIHAFEFKLFRQ